MGGMDRCRYPIETVDQTDVAGQLHPLPDGKVSSRSAAVAVVNAMPERQR